MTDKLYRQAAGQPTAKVSAASAAGGITASATGGLTVPLAVVLSWGFQAIFGKELELPVAIAMASLLSGVIVWGVALLAGYLKRPSERDHIIEEAGPMPLGGMTNL